MSRELADEALAILELSAAGDRVEILKVLLAEAEERLAQLQNDDAVKKVVLKMMTTVETTDNAAVIPGNMTATDNAARACFLPGNMTEDGK